VPSLPAAFERSLEDLEPLFDAWHPRVDAAWKTR
jgi:hypothetical protein